MLLQIMTPIAAQRSLEEIAVVAVFELVVINMCLSDESTTPVHCFDGVASAGDYVILHSNKT